MVVTTVKLEQKTKKELDTFREYKNESYDEVISKIIFIAKNVKDRPELSEETINAIEASRRRVSQGQVISSKEMKKRLGL